MLQYIIKLSICLAVLYIFYRAVLRPLTFYQCNRFYLLCYSLLSFAIPFINIAPWVQGKENQSLIHFIPVISYHTADVQTVATTPGWLQRLTATDWLLFVVAVGTIIMLVKLGLQYLSLRRIRNNAILLKADAGIQLYETSATVSPFSFGNAIYINRRLHTPEELQRIIQHEFVHVQQKHTIDLLVAELLCVFNWFNPFAWLIRSSIRQNLEFIADSNVVENGIDKKEYQYLLLKVTGAPQYSIAGHFNLSNLKKRIAMMNKMKSTRLHLAKFLFVLPLMAVLLLAFRSNKKQLPANNNTEARESYINTVEIPGLVQQLESASRFTDTLPPPPPAEPAINPGLPAPVRTQTMPNNKGYIVTIADNNGECIVLVKDKKKSIIKAITLTDWNNNRAANESTYGKIPPPPPPPVPGAPAKPAPPVEDAKSATPEPAEAPEKAVIDAISERPALAGSEDVIATHAEISEHNGNRTSKVTVTLKNGTKEVYNLNNAAEKTAYEKKYNKPLPPVKAAAPAKSTPATLQIRQANSAAPAAQPLFVIDGIEQASPFNANSIAPNSIKSMNVLKGDRATLLYGSKGANGVIQINTRVPIVMVDSTMVAPVVEGYRLKQ